MTPATIVVVDDDTAYVDMVSDLLADAGYRIHSCTESRDAYGLITREKPDVVLLDIRMEHPESGMNVLTLLRLDQDTAALPVIVCSADVGFLRATADHLHAHGCVVLEKPFLIAVLEDIIASIVGPSSVTRTRETNTEHATGSDRGGQGGAVRTAESRMPSVEG